jgi:hypothetical protein
MSETHLDLDALADVLASGAEPAHVGSCPSCRARLAELGTAMPAVTAALAALPAPELPDDLADRLAGTVQRATERGPADVLPLAPRRSVARWMPALAGVAAAAALAVGAVVLTGNGDSSRTATDAASGPGYRVNDTGTQYDATTLAAAVPRLLDGTAPESQVGAAPGDASQTYTGALQATPGPSPTGGERTADTAVPKAALVDPLAELRTTAGLARCLSTLTDPSEEGLPLALDYASYQGKPALVVVLPSSKADKVDVFVVPAGCAQADGQVLYFTRLPKP